MKDKLRKMFLGVPADRKAPEGQISSSQPAFYARHSHGLDQFFAHIRDHTGLSLLDLGGINQDNVSFITNLGHRLYSEDFLRSAAGDESPELGLDFAEGSLDGVLVWDTLEFLPGPLLKDTVDRLHRIVKPGSCLLSFFHAEEKALEVPCYSYRIADATTLLLAPRGTRTPVQLFNNRSIERLFHTFRSVKFFLARDHLREVIITR